MKKNEESLRKSNFIQINRKKFKIIKIIKTISLEGQMPKNGVKSKDDVNQVINALV